MKIVLAPQAVLYKPVKRVKKIDQPIKHLVKEMLKTLEVQHDPEGVGLAANQVGQSLALFIIKSDPDKPAIICINPVILKTEDKKPKIDKIKKIRKKKRALEGCLSIPKIWGSVERKKRVLLSYKDIDGVSQKKWFSGLEAVIVQHEMDHLEGVLFTQRVLEQKNILYKEKNGEFEEYEI